MYGLSIADQFIRTGQYRCILLVGAEIQSTWIDYNPEGRTVGVLFRDRAGAVVVEAMPEAVGVVYFLRTYTVRALMRWSYA